MKRFLPIVLVALLAGAAGLWMSLRHTPAPTSPPTVPMPALKAVRLFPHTRSLPAFSLQQGDGQPLTGESLKGHWTLVFLGFTHCPDVCPTTLAQMAQAQKQWAALPAATRPRVLFVSVDPQRDTPDITAKYARAFHPDTLAATGNLPALEAFARSLSLVFMINPPADGAPANQYSVDHSAAMAVLDPQARMAGILQPPLQPDAIADDLIALSQAAP